MLHIFKEIGVCFKWLEIIHLLKQEEFEALPGVIIPSTLLFHFDEYIREVVAEVEEDGLVETGHRAVVRTLDSGRASYVGQDSNFSEVFSLSKLSDKYGVAHVIFDPDRTVSLCDQKEAVSSLPLSNDGVLWQVE